MMRYIVKENRVEYTRTTPRATAGCIAFVGSKIPQADAQPAEPPQAPQNEPQTPETEKDEEQSMEEQKTPTAQELTPVEGWTDPEPNTATTIKDRISALLSVKSIITLAFVGTYLAMVLQRQEVPNLFENILTMIVSFFFGYQFRKAEK